MTTLLPFQPDDSPLKRKSKIPDTLLVPAYPQSQPLAILHTISGNTSPAQSVTESERPDRAEANNGHQFAKRAACISAKATKAKTRNPSHTVDSSARTQASEQICHAKPKESHGSPLTPKKRKHFHDLDRRAGAMGCEVDHGTPSRLPDPASPASS